MGVGVDLGKEFHPFSRSHDQIEETFDDIESLHSVGMCGQPLPYLKGCIFGFFTRNAQEGENHERKVSFKLALGGGQHVGGQLLFYFHIVMFVFLCGGMSEISLPFFLFH